MSKEIKNYDFFLSDPEVRTAFTTLYKNEKAAKKKLQGEDYEDHVDTIREDFMKQMLPLVQAQIKEEKEMRRETSRARKQAAMEESDREASPPPARKNGKDRKVPKDSADSNGKARKARKVSGPMSVAEAMAAAEDEAGASAPAVSFVAAVSAARALAGPAAGAAARDDDVVDLTKSDAE